MRSKKMLLLKQNKRKMVVANEKLTIKHLHSCYKIIAIDFSENEIRFEIEDIFTPQYTFFLTSVEIMSSNNLLKYFSASDKAIICFQLTKEAEQKHVNIRNKGELARGGCAWMKKIK